MLRLCWRDHELPLKLIGICFIGGLDAVIDRECLQGNNLVFFVDGCMAGQYPVRLAVPFSYAVLVVGGAALHNHLRQGAALFGTKVDGSGHLLPLARLGLVAFLQQLFQIQAIVDCTAVGTRNVSACGLSVSHWDRWIIVLQHFRGRAVVQLMTGYDVDGAVVDLVDSLIDRLVQ